MPTIQFRTDETIKTQSSELFRQLGITMSDAINMFLRQSIVNGGLPFTPTIEKESAVDNKRMETLHSFLEFTSANERIENDFKFDRNNYYDE